MWGWEGLSTKFRFPSADLENPLGDFRQILLVASFRSPNHHTSHVIFIENIHVFVPVSYKWYDKSFLGLFLNSSSSLSSSKPVMWAPHWSCRGLSGVQGRWSWTWRWSPLTTSSTSEAAPSYGWRYLSQHTRSESPKVNFAAWKPTRLASQPWRRAWFFLDSSTYLFISVFFP